MDGKIDGWKRWMESSCHGGVGRDLGEIKYEKKRKGEV